MANAEVEKTLVNTGEIKHCQRRQKSVLELQIYGRGHPGCLLSRS